MRKRDEPLADLAGAILDGAPVPWTSVESTTDEPTKAVIRQLKVVAEIAQIHRGDPAIPGAQGANAGAMDLPMEPLEQWGHLKILEFVGSGSFGEVYRAWDTRLEREVALKLLRQEGNHTAVLREARLLARVRHPHIVTVFDAAEFEGRAGFWMEFIQGQNLEEMLRENGPLPARDVIRLGIELAGALAAAHRAGLQHRDVKTQNVIRARDDRIVLMDFGAGDELEPEGSASNQPAGTPLYMAPEILTGGRTTQSCDIYGLGVLLYRVATDAYPVSGATLDELRTAHSHQRRRRLLDVRHDFPREAARIIDRALEPDSSRRFPSAAEMARALQRAERRLAHAGRRKIILAAASLALALVVTGVSPVVRPWRQGLLRLMARMSGASLRVGAAAEQTRLEMRADFLVGAVSMDDRLMSVSDPGMNLSVRNMATGEESVLVRSSEEGGHAYHSWPSPDSSEVAYSWVSKACDCMQLNVVATGGGSPRVMVRDEKIAEIVLGGWSADKQHVLALLVPKYGEPTMSLVSTVDGSVHVLKSSRNLGAGMSLSPDGRFVAYVTPSTASPGHSAIHVLSADGAVDQPAVEDDSDNTQPFWAPDGSRLIFASNRSGSTSLWAVPVTNGRVTASPILVRKDIGRISVLSLTSTGSLYYRLQAGIVDVHTARIDLDSKAITDGPRAISSKTPGSNLAPDWSADGRLLAFLSMPLASGRQARALTVRSNDDGSEYTIPVNLGFILIPRWSPEGRRLLIKGMQHGVGPVNLYVADARTGRILDTIIENEDFGWPVWDANSGNMYVVMGQPGKSIVSLNVETRDRREIYREELTIAQQVALTRDGQWLGFATFGKNQVHIRIMPVSGGAAREVYRGTPSVQIWDFADHFLLFTMRTGPSGKGPENELWAVPINGGEAFSLGLRMDGLRALRVHPDGRTIAFTAGSPTHEFWVLQNLLSR